MGTLCGVSWTLLCRAAVVKPWLQCGGIAKWGVWWPWGWPRGATWWMRLCVKLEDGVAQGGGRRDIQVVGGWFYAGVGLVAVTRSLSIIESQQSHS